MFTFKEPLENPIDQLVWANALLVFLTEVTDRNGESLDLSQDAVIGLSTIIETASGIVKDVISDLEKNKQTKYACNIVIINKQKE